MQWTGSNLQRMFKSSSSGRYTCVWQDAAPVSFVCELEGRHTLDLVRLQNSPSLWLPWSLETFSSQRTLMAAFIVSCFPIRGLVFLYRKSETTGNQPRVTNVQLFLTYRNSDFTCLHFICCELDGCGHCGAGIQNSGCLKRFIFVNKFFTSPHWSCIPKPNVKPFRGRSQPF